MYDALCNRVSAHPTVPFWFIVNPASGPGDSGTQPDSVNQACFAQLKTYSNAEVLGYVHTSVGTRSSTDVITDIETYAAWSSSYRPVGIFFDEAATSASDQSLYATYESSVRSNFGSSSTVSFMGEITSIVHY